MNTTQKLIDSYTSWLRNELKISNLKENVDVVNTPYLNSISDNIRFYVEHFNSKVRLSDDGETFNNLYLNGIDINTKQRKVEINRIISQFNTNISDENIYIEGNYEDFPIMEHNLISTLINVDSLNMTKRKSIYKMFREDVLNYFDKNDFGGLPNWDISGASGVSYKIDYTLPQIKKRPTIFLEIQNTLNNNLVSAYAYEYQDIKRVSDRKLETAIIYNDEHSTPSDKAKKIAKSEKIKLIPFNNKNELKELTQIYS